MGFTAICLAYGFGVACLVNFLIMRVRLATATYYTKCAERLRVMREGGDEAQKAEEEERRRPFKICFLHPDLGIGGAERLILDAAIGLQRHQKVHPMDVFIVTPHHDKERCFKETVDGTVKVVVRGGWLPASILGRCKVLCATLRMIAAGFSICNSTPDIDVFVVDQVAAVMPPLRFFAPCTPIFFYCHFPDQKCNPNRNPDGTVNAAASLGVLSSVYTAYRGLFDRIEAISIMAANSVVCNSRFTCQVTKDTFPEMKDRIHMDEDVFYPPVAPPLPATATAPDAALQGLADPLQKALSRHTTVFVSINRYERNKNLLLAVEAFAELLAQAEHPSSFMLVMAGGYDSRLPENVSYYKEIEEAARGRLKIPVGQFLLLRNVSDAEKQMLLRSAWALLYTPANEHFGIAPVEAMMHGKPVIAVNHGGPCESVGDVEATPDAAGGILCEPTPAAFCEAMCRLTADRALAERLGAQGRKRALGQFSMEQFSEKMAARLVRLRNEVEPLVWETYKEAAGWRDTSAATPADDPSADTQPATVEKEREKKVH